MLNISFGKKVCSLITIGILFFLTTTPGLALNMGDGISQDRELPKEIIIGLLCCLLAIWLFWHPWQKKPQTRSERRRQLRKIGYFKRV